MSTGNIIDVFISFQWDSKQLMLLLYKKLSDYNLRAYMDEVGIEICTKRVSLKTSEILRTSKVFLVALTKSYCETVNLGDIYAQEMYYASTLNIPFIILELEHLTIGDIGDVAFLINSYKRFNCYKIPNIDWTGENFSSILKEIQKKSSTDFKSKKRNIEKKTPILVLDLL